jgi:hypothetical protein
MTNKINISISKPCRENWEVMTASDKGKFCALCQKNVIDFTSFSDREILNHYNQNSEVCGRFTASQLNRNLIIPKEKSSIWIAISSAIIWFLGMGSQDVYSQESIKTEQTDNKIQTGTISKTKKKITKKTSGIVTDGKIPVPGVNVFIKGTSLREQTDIDGNYSIEAKKGDIIVFSFIGYQNVEKKFSKSSIINVCLKEEIIFMGEVIIEEN